MGAEEELAAAKKRLADLEADVEKWKGLSRKHEDRAKENASAADELKQLKESHLSDQQKREQADKAQADKMAELEKRLNNADSRALRAEVAAAKKLTPAQAKRLSGTTREELEADADELLDTFKPSDTDGEPGRGTRTARPASRPRENLSGGGDPTDEVPVETNPAKLAESVPRH